MNDAVKITYQRLEKLSVGLEEDVTIRCLIIHMPEQLW